MWQNSTDALLYFLHKRGRADLALSQIMNSKKITERKEIKDPTLETTFHLMNISG